MNGALSENEISGSPIPLWKYYFPNQGITNVSLVNVLIYFK